MKIEADAPEHAEPAVEEPIAAAAPADDETASVVAPSIDPAAPASGAGEDDALSEIEARREALRQRIRELGARRTTPALPDLAPLSLGDSGSSEERRERISLRLAAARNRRVSLQAQGQGGEGDL